MPLNNSLQIRTLVVDDEPLARQRVISLLKNYSEIQVIGESRNGEEAVADIQSKKPDLIFLDIEMPGMDGFGVISNIDLNYKPFIIFATAYNQYALKAFNIHAIDYLLKPFDDERFDEALEIAKNQIKLRHSSQFNEKLIKLINDYNTEPEKYVRQFKIKLRGREKFIPTESIYYIEAEGNYLMLHHENGRDLFRSTMASIEKELKIGDWANGNDTLAKEATRVYELYLSGILREIYFNDKHCAVLILECENLGSAEKSLSTLPLVQKGLISFEVMELNPYTGLNRIMKD